MWSLKLLKSPKIVIWHAFSPELASATIKENCIRPPSTLLAGSVALSLFKALMLFHLMRNDGECSQTAQLHYNSLEDMETFPTQSSPYSFYSPFLLQLDSHLFCLCNTFMTVMTATCYFLQLFLCCFGLIKTVKAVRRYLEHKHKCLQSL